MPPFRLVRLDHLLLLVDDMPAALDFYTNVLGATVAERLDEYGMVELTAGTSGLALVDISAPAGAWARPASADGKNLDHFCLAVTGASFCAYLTAAGRPIVEEGDASVYTLDPAGNQVELRVVAG